MLHLGRMYEHGRIEGLIGCVITNWEDQDKDGEKKLNSAPFLYLPSLGSKDRYEYLQYPLK